jgi:prepilin-type N-terminal cleavage/methylation domain-containing protein
MSMRESCVRGFVLSELLVALAIVLIVSAGLAWVGEEARAHAAVQPELADLAQRARVGVDMLERELLLAGAGPYRGDVVGPLPRWVPAVFPDRRVATAGGTSLFDDVAITVLRVPEGAAQAGLAEGMRGAGDVVTVKAGGACTPGTVACGFNEGQRAIVFDRLAGFDLFTVEAVGPGLFGHQPGVFTRSYRPESEAIVSQVVATTFYFDAEKRQVRRSLGVHADVPVVDQVVGLGFQYYGDPFPPEGPRPAAGEGNCLYDESGVGRLGILSGAEGGLVRLRPEQLTDGPFCGEGLQRFDADLYRVRRVRIVLRLQVAAESLRGRDPLRFRVPGSCAVMSRQVPDLEVRFDVSPVNLQLR